MSPEVALILWIQSTQNADIVWRHGPVYAIEANVANCRAFIEEVLERQHSEAILFWDSEFGSPDGDLILRLLAEPVDVWHAGLKLGTRGEPYGLDYLMASWSLLVDPDPERRAASWRLSFRAALIRTNVLQALGQLHPSMESLDAAALDLGYRYAWNGAILVNEPRMISVGPDQPLLISRTDFFRFSARHFNSFWQKYALCRRILSSGFLREEYHAYSLALREPFREPPEVIGRYERRAGVLREVQSIRISVIIPTLCRYRYLRDTLRQLSEQRLKPAEVICVDQTPEEIREPAIYNSYSDLNLKVIWRDQPGQCSARNAGLEEAKSYWILFLDDDVQIPPDFLYNLSAGLLRYQADYAVSVWTADQRQSTSANDRKFRLADRFSANGSLVSRRAVCAVGGFDLNYDRNYRADADLGMRLYLGGYLGIVVPDALQYSISAPEGGLKTFGGFDGIRKIGLLAPWPASTQMYFWLRYLTSRQIREALVLTFVGAAIPREIRYRITRTQKTLYFVRHIFTLPFRLFGMYRSYREAQGMLKVGPQLHRFEENP